MVTDNHAVLLVENFFTVLELQLQKTSHVGYGCTALGQSQPTFGSNLRALMNRSGVRVTDVAKALGVVKSAVSGWLHDKVDLPNTPTLLRLAKAVGCTVDELLVGLDPAYDKVRDLIRQGSDQQSGTSSPGDPRDDPAATRMELQRLSDLVARYEKEAREVLQISDDLHEIATRMEEVRKAPKGTSRRSSRHRKAG
jgi:transcriptional regulator with XRE-family HTH domain